MPNYSKYPETFEYRKINIPKIEQLSNANKYVGQLDKEDFLSLKGKDLEGLLYFIFNTDSENYLNDINACEGHDVIDKMISVIYECKKACDDKNSNGIYVSQKAKEMLNSISQIVGRQDRHNDTIIAMANDDDEDVIVGGMGVTVDPWDGHAYYVPITSESNINNIDVISKFCDVFGNAENIISNTVKSDGVRNFLEFGKENNNARDNIDIVVNNGTNNMLSIANLFAMFVTIVPMIPEYLGNTDRIAVVRDLARRVDIPLTERGISLASNLTQRIANGDTINSENIQGLLRDATDVFTNNTSNAQISNIRDRLIELKESLPSGVNWPGVITTTASVVSCAMSDYLMRKEISKRIKKDIGYLEKKCSVIPSTFYARSIIKDKYGSDIFGPGNITLSDKTKNALKALSENVFVGLGGNLVKGVYQLGNVAIDSVYGNRYNVAAGEDVNLEDVLEEESMRNIDTLFNGVRNKGHELEWSQLCTGLTLIAAVGMTNHGDVGWSGDAQIIAKKIMLTSLSLFPSWANQYMHTESKKRDFDRMIGDVQELIDSVNGKMVFNEKGFNRLINTFPHHEKLFKQMRKDGLIKIDPKIKENRGADVAEGVANILAGTGLIVNAGLAIYGNVFNRTVGVGLSLVQLGGSYAAQLSGPVKEYLQNSGAGNIYNMIRGFVGNTLGLSVVLGLNFSDIFKNNQVLFLRLIGSAGIGSNLGISALQAKNATNMQDSIVIEKILSDAYDELLPRDYVVSDLERSKQILALQYMLSQVMNDNELVEKIEAKNSELYRLISRGNYDDNKKSDLFINSSPIFKAVKSCLLNEGGSGREDELTASLKDIYRRGLAVAEVASITDSVAAGEGSARNWVRDVERDQRARHSFADGEGGLSDHGDDGHSRRRGAGINY